MRHDETREEESATEQAGVTEGKRESENVCKCVCACEWVSEHRAGLLLWCWTLNILNAVEGLICVRARVWWTLLKMTRNSVQEAAWMWHIRVTRSSQLFIHIDVRHYPFNKFNSFSRSSSVGISSISSNGSNNIAPRHGCLFSRSLVRPYACLFAPTSTYRECQQFNLGK